MIKPFTLLVDAIKNRLIKWLLTEVDSFTTSTGSDFMRVEEKIKPADVLLIQGKSRVSNDDQGLFIPKKIDS